MWCNTQDLLIIYVLIQFIEPNTFFPAGDDSNVVARITNQIRRANHEPDVSPYMDDTIIIHEASVTYMRQWFEKNRQSLNPHKMKNFLDRAIAIVYTFRFPGSHHAPVGQYLLRIKFYTSLSTPQSFSSTETFQSHLFTREDAERSVREFISAVEKLKSRPPSTFHPSFSQSQNAEAFPPSHPSSPFGMETKTEMPFPRGMEVMWPPLSPLLEGRMRRFLVGVIEKIDRYMKTPGIIVTSTSNIHEILKATQIPPDADPRPAIELITQILAADEAETHLWRNQDKKRLFSAISQSLSKIYSGGD